MTIALRSRPRVLVLVFVLVLVAGALTIVVANPARGTGADWCVGHQGLSERGAGDDPYTIGDTVTCTLQR